MVTTDDNLTSEFESLRHRYSRLSSPHQARLAEAETDQILGLGLCPTRGETPSGECGVNTDNPNMFTKQYHGGPGLCLYDLLRTPHKPPWDGGECPAGSETQDQGSDRNVSKVTHKIMHVADAFGRKSAILQLTMKYIFKKVD